jgi:hypothetical protein
LAGGKKVDRGSFLDRNLHVLKNTNPDLSFRLKKTEASVSRYKFLKSKNGELIPALADPHGVSRPLHSMMDPGKEAQRLISTVEHSSFLILLGLGGAYYAEAALERDDICMVLVIEYDLGGLAELLRHKDYTNLFEDPRFRIFADPPEEELKESILNLYQPVLFGGIRLIPLRPRTELDAEHFAAAKKAVQTALDKVSADYSVQAHFGRRWFSNIMRNLKAAELIEGALPQVRRTAITAAGPSLSAQIPNLKKKRNELFLIAVDTSLPCLLQEGLTPDAVISIDCQHISYLHFMDRLPKEVLLFLDLSSPPLLSRFSKRPMFFSGGHPLTRYISQIWKAMPEPDCSGGNVTYAAVSFAELLGAAEIELYGADFSYPVGVSYARGAYVYSWFEKKHHRLSPLEAHASSFIYRTPLEKKRRSGDFWYYETQTLRFYREKLEEKSRGMEAAIIPIQGLGAPIQIAQGKSRCQGQKIFFYHRATMEAEKFLSFYRTEIAGLPKAGKKAANYLASLKDRERSVFTTMLPIAAALKQRHTTENFIELIEETKAYCLKEIDKTSKS